MDKSSILLDSLIGVELLKENPYITSLLVLQFITPDNTEFSLSIEDFPREVLPMTANVPNKDIWGNFLNDTLKHSITPEDFAAGKRVGSIREANVTALFHHPLLIDGEKHYGKFTHIKCSDDYSTYELSDIHFTTLSETANRYGMSESQLLLALSSEDKPE